MSGPGLAPDGNLGDGELNEPNHAAIMRRLRAPGRSLSSARVPTSNKRTSFSELNGPAKRRANNLIRAAISQSDGGQGSFDCEEGRLTLQAAYHRANPEAQEIEAKAAMFDTFAGHFKQEGLSKAARSVKRVLVDQLVKGVAAGQFSQRQLSRVTGIHRGTLRAAARRQVSEVAQSLHGALILLSFA
jgi:hypothetical protein